MGIILVFFCTTSGYKYPRWADVAMLFAARTNGAWALNPTGLRVMLVNTPARSFRNGGVETIARSHNALGKRRFLVVRAGGSLHAIVHPKPLILFHRGQELRLPAARDAPRGCRMMLRTHGLIRYAPLALNQRW